MASLLPAHPTSDPLSQGRQVSTHGGLDLGRALSSAAVSCQLNCRPIPPSNPTREPPNRPLAWRPPALQRKTLLDGASTNPSVAVVDVVGSRRQRARKPGHAVLFSRPLLILPPSPAFLGFGGFFLTHTPQCAAKRGQIGAARPKSPASASSRVFRLLVLHRSPARRRPRLLLSCYVAAS